MNIKIERPTLNRPTIEENMAIVDKWIADTSDKLNMFVSDINRRMGEIENAGIHTDTTGQTW
jgi:hypothetical protein